MALAIFETEVEVEPEARGSNVGPGALSGVIAGSMMALFAMCAHWALGNGFWTLPKEIGAVFYGVDALVGGAGAVLAGLVVHFVVSACWGILYASILPGGSSPWTALWTGVVYGVGVWAIMTYGVLPWGNEIQSARIRLLPNWWFYSHLVFGASLLVTPIVRRRFAAGIDGRRLEKPLPRTRIPV